MKFDYTWIRISGITIFEPLVLVTNLILFFIGLYIFVKNFGIRMPYFRCMATFPLLLGVGSVFGALVHNVHYQLGPAFVKNMNFCSNICTMMSAFCLFRASFRLQSRPFGHLCNILPVVAFIWAVAVIVLTYFINNFMIISIHAGVTLIYALYVHLKDYRLTGNVGSRIIVTGIVISFLPIIVHAMRLSLGAWFNHKDIAHVIMIISLSIIGKGISTLRHEMQVEPVF